jgi:hypothetical protein
MVKDSVSELKEIVNSPDTISAFGRTYVIKKFTFGPMTQALEYVGPISYLFKKLMEMPKDDKGNIAADPTAMMDFAVTAASISGPSIFGIVSVATQEPTEWLEEQDAIEGMKIFAKVVEKNLDFFSQENLSLLTSLVGGLQQKIPESGGD